MDRRERRIACDDATLHPYADLTPDRVLDALESVGLARRRPAAGAQQLREPRLPDRHRGRARRSSRSSTGRGAGPDAQILEEHAFVAELAAREIPVVAPLTLARQHAARVRRLPLRRLPAGAAAGRPSSTTAETLEWMGRFLGRIHAVGALRAVPAPAGARHRAPSATSRATGCSRTASFRRISLDAWRSIAAQALDGVRRCFDRAGDVRDAAAARRLPRRQRAVDRARRDARPAFRRLRRRAHGPGGAGPVDAALRRSRRDDAPARATCSPATRTSTSSIRASCTSSRRCARCACSTTRRGSRGAGTTRRFPRRFPWFNTQRYWQDRILELREQVALMDEPPLRSS